MESTLRSTQNVSSLLKEYMELVFISSDKHQSNYPQKPFKSQGSHLLPISISKWNVMIVSDKLINKHRDKNFVLRRPAKVAIRNLTLG